MQVHLLITPMSNKLLNNINFFKLFCDITSHTSGIKLTCTTQKLSFPTRNWNCRKASMYGIPSISPTVPPSWGEKSNRISLKFGNTVTVYYCGKLKAKFVQCTFEVMDHYTGRLPYCETTKVKVFHKMTSINYSNTVNPLSPNGDQHQFSPNHIQRLSRDLVMRINKLIT